MMIVQRMMYEVAFRVRFENFKKECLGVLQVSIMDDFQE